LHAHARRASRRDSDLWADFDFPGVGARVAAMRRPIAAFNPLFVTKNLECELRSETEPVSKRVVWDLHRGQGDSSMHKPKEEER
jgi:hypothetical protein